MIVLLLNLLILSPARNESGNIVGYLARFAEKAEARLSDLRKEEVDNRHNYEMLKQSLKDEIKFDAEATEAATKGISGSTEHKATAEGYLDVTKKELSEGKAARLS